LHTGGARLTMRATRMVLLLSALLVAAPVSKAELAVFARCLNRAGATYYTADWCPHCRRQNALFGDALRYVKVVDCTNGCSEVKSLPTWTFRDGSRVTGFTSLDELAERTGCRTGGEPDADGDDPQHSSLGGRAFLADAR